MEKTVVELFAGVGGFRVGLNKSSNEWEFAWANQWEPSRKGQDAFDCYTYHFGKENHINKDISTIDKNSIPQHNLLVGGFPCQDYSVARTGAQGIKGKKGVLWWDIYETIKAKEPQFVLLENVDRLLKSPSNQRGRDFGVILACFKELNYSVEWRVINAADYGFPQRRRRVFVFAYKNTTNYSIQLERFTVKDIVRTNGFYQSEFPALVNENNRHIPNTVQFDFIDLVDVSEHFSMIFCNSGIMKNNQIHTEELIPIMNSNMTPKFLRDILESGVDERFYLNGELDDWNYMKGSKRIERTHRDGHKYTFSEGAIAFPDPIDRPARTMLTSEASKNRSTHIIRDPETNRLRKLTPLECERLNGFPDNWTNTGMSERFRYFCMGNALVVNLVELMGQKLNEIFESEE